MQSTKRTPSRKRLRCWTRVRLADKSHHTETLARQRSIRLRSWIEGARPAPYPHYELQARSQLAGEICNWVALAFVRGAPRLLASIVEWSEFLSSVERPRRPGHRKNNASPRGVFMALEELVRLGHIERTYYLTGLRDAEEGGGPKTRRFRACGYMPGPLMRMWFDSRRKKRWEEEKKRNHDRALRRSVQASGQLRSDRQRPLNLCTIDAHARARELAQKEEAKERQTASSTRHRSRWPRIYADKRTEKEARVRALGDRMVLRETMAQMHAPLRPPGGLRREIIRTTDPNSEKPRAGDNPAPYSERSTEEERADYLAEQARRARLLLRLIGGDDGEPPDKRRK